MAYAWITDQYTIKISIYVGKITSEIIDVNLIKGKWWIYYCYWIIPHFIDKANEITDTTSPRLVKYTNISTNLGPFIYKRGAKTNMLITIQINLIICKVRWEIMVG